MADTREEMARAICASDFDGDRSVYDQMSEDQRANFTINADAAIAVLRPGARFTVNGVECVVVPWAKDADFEVLSNGEYAASASGPREQALAHAMHYAAVYAQDGPVEVVELVRLPLRACEEK